MVLFTLCVFAVSLSFLAYKYGVGLSLLTSKSPDVKHAAKEKSPEPGRQGKPRPAVTVTAPEVEKETGKASTRQAKKMKDPFQEAEDQDPVRNVMAPPTLNSIPNSKRVAPNGLMAPPSPFPSKLLAIQTPRKSSNIASPRPPPSTASTLRAPPGRSPATSSLLTPSTSTLAPSTRPSRKVQLEPGHSPLDWAHLTSNPPTPTFLRGAGVPPQLIRVPPSLLKHHNGRKDKETGERKDAWGVWQGKVYNLTPYMKFHPGGEDQLMRGAGNTKAEALFNETHRWISWDSMMNECLVGILVSENEARRDDSMEEMD